MSLDKKNLPFAKLASIREKHTGEKIALCFGFFDLLNYPTLEYLRSAKKQGDRLVVLIASDAVIRQHSGYSPYSEKQRVAMLTNLEMVDYIVISPYPSAAKAIEQLCPNVYVRLPSYRDPQRDTSGYLRQEEDALKEVGASLVFSEGGITGSKVLLEQFFGAWTSNQAEAIRRVSKTFGLKRLLKALEDLQKTRVLVVGEPIVDTYVFCDAENISSKSPSISARYLHEENYPGGSLAIARHLNALGCPVTLLITHGGEPYFQEMLHSSLDPKIHIEEQIIPNMPTPRKTRFVVPFKNQRLFELTHLRADQWEHFNPDPFCQRMLKLSRAHDVVMMADFGHGLFEGRVLQTTQHFSSFVATNVQTNSGNLGFNPFTKHQKYNYLSMDERECRLAVHDRLTPIRELAQKTVKTKIKKPAAITLGQAGSLYFDRKQKEHFCPVFFREVVDTIGAGDAYFTITALLAKQNVPGEIIPFIGNCYAGLKTRILGNKEAVSKEDLINTLKVMFDSVK